MGRVSLGVPGKLWMITAMVAIPFLGFPSSGDGDHAAGTGETEDSRFELAAESDAGGAQAHGFLKSQSTDEDGRLVTIAGPVTCLYVLDRYAGIGARIERSSDPSLVGLGALFTVLDGGPPAGGQSPDKASPVVPISEPPREGECPISISPDTLSPIEHGNVEVKDS